MIVCYIDGAAAYPSTSSSIKVTFENAAIKDRESRTQELTFNLGIADNRKVFGAVNRIDVKKSAATFATCRLYADNLLVIEGEGTITSYSDAEVKLQIKTATAASQFPDSFSAKYIDQLEGLPNYGFDKELLIPIYDEANSQFLNGIGVTFAWHQRLDTQGDEGDEYKEVITSYTHCIQPVLRDAILSVVSALGFTIPDGSLGVLDDYPFNCLRIANGNQTTKLADILPHWTAYKFFTELSNLFNMAFRFDDINKTLKVTANATVTSDSDAATAAYYDCLDEFSSDYDEDGETLLQASNLAYNLSSSSEWQYADIEQDIVQDFEVEEYSSYDALKAAWDGMTEREKRTKIFLTPTCGYFTAKGDDDTLSLQAVPLMHLVRQHDTDDTFDLDIVPVPLGYLDVPVRLVYEEYDKYGSLSYTGTSEETLTMAVPSINSSKTLNDESYVTVEDRLDDTDSDKTEEQERMEIFFIDGSFNKGYTHPNFEAAGFKIAKCFTYNGSNPDYSNNFTLTLCDTATYYSVANLHSKASRVENRETIVIKFEADDLPDPRKTYVFRGKRFLCDKIELEITADGISKIKTGYFFEMQ